MFFKRGKVISDQFEDIFFWGKVGEACVAEERSPIPTALFQFFTKNCVLLVNTKKCSFASKMKNSPLKSAVWENFPHNPVSSLMAGP